MFALEASVTSSWRLWLAEIVFERKIATDSRSANYICSSLCIANPRLLQNVDAILAVKMARGKSWQDSARKYLI
jgi:hypothetical protein